MILGASTERGTMKQYLGQLEHAGIDYFVQKIEDWAKANTVGDCVASQMALAKRFEAYDKLVFSDAFDVRFYGLKEDVLAKIPSDEVLLAGERNCFPDESLRDSMPGKTPWRFVNGGLMAGTPAQIRVFLTLVATHRLFDGSGVNQAFYNRLKHLGQLPAKVDETTTLFYCLHSEQDDLHADAHGLPVNTRFQTRPNFIHANGESSTQEIFREG